MIAIALGVFIGGIVAAFFGPAWSILVGVVAMLVLIAYVAGQAIHDVRHGG